MHTPTSSCAQKPRALCFRAMCTSESNPKHPIIAYDLHVATMLFRKFAVDTNWVLQGMGQGCGQHGVLPTEAKGGKLLVCVPP